MSSTVPPPTEPQAPSIEERVSALKGEAADIWKYKGDLAAAEAKNSETPAEIDVPAASSPATETPSAEPPVSDEDDDEDSGTEATSDTAVVEQPVAAEQTGLTKSERKKYNDYKRYLKEKTRADFLEKQIAELKAASAPAKPEEKPETVEDLPEIPDIDTFDDPKEFSRVLRKQMADYVRRQLQAQTSTLRAQTEAEKSQAAFTQRTEAAKVKYGADFEKKTPYFADKDFPSSDAINYVIRSHGDGFDYAHALTKAEAKRIADLTHVPDLENLQKTNPARASALMSRAVTVAEYELKALLKPAAAPPRQPTGQKPTSEVRLDRPGSPVADVRAKAIVDGDFRSFKQLENAKLRKA